MMKKKGFTLIELLAVIVVLSIIALITLPVVFNAIESAKEGAALASANAYASQIETYIMLTELDPTKPKLQTGVAYQLSSSNYEVASLADPETTFINDLIDMKGEEPNSGYVIINEDKKIAEMEMYVDTYLIEYKKEKESCAIKGKQESSEESGGDKDPEEEKPEDKIEHELGATIEVDTIYDLVKESYKEDGLYKAKLSNGEEIDFEMYNIKGDTTYDSTPTLCNDTNDIMCIYKYNGNLTIGEGVILQPQAGKEGARKKGFVVYVKDTLTNNGEISMTARGANAEGQDVLLYKNSDNSYEYVPKEGASGAAGATKAVGVKTVAGINGTDGSGRQTGGGGSGAAIGLYNNTINYTGTFTSGAGTAGTSYSGGTGGGGAPCYNSANRPCTPEDGTINGGKGGSGFTTGGTGSWSGYQNQYAGGGAGNPGGVGKKVLRSNQTQNATEYSGGTGTGGLLIIYTKDLVNNTSITSKGVSGGNGYAGGGSSGGGSVNIFYSGNITLGTIDVTGGAAAGKSKKGGIGGSGTYTVCSISTGSCIK